jgi:hypothetical protein
MGKGKRLRKGGSGLASWKRPQNLANQSLANRRKPLASYKQPSQLKQRQLQNQPTNKDNTKRAKPRQLFYHYAGQSLHYCTNKSPKANSIRRRQRYSDLQRIESRNN